MARLTLVRSLIASRDSTQLARAERELKKLEAEYPQVAAVHVQAGALALAKNDVATARTQFEQAQALDPRSAEPVAGLIALAFRRKDNAGAKALIEAATQGGKQRRSPGACGAHLHGPQRSGLGRESAAGGHY